MSCGALRNGDGVVSTVGEEVRKEDGMRVLIVETLEMGV
jgi:hypothetical protein